MMESNERKGHTPGPWLYRPEKYDDWGTVRAAPDAEGRMFHICQARNPAILHADYDKYRESGTDPFEANARLIAAAPELLGALEDIASATMSMFVTQNDMLLWMKKRAGDAASRAAITKAEG